MLPALSIEKKKDIQRAPSPSENLPHAFLKNQLGENIGVSFIYNEKYWIQIQNIALFSYKRNETHARAFPAKDCPSGSIRDTFEKIVLPLYVQAQGKEALHGSALLSPSGVIAFCADSGTGKSTLAAYISKKTGWPIWADDIVIVDSLPDKVQSLWLPFKVDLSCASQRITQFSEDLILSSQSGIHDAPLMGIFELKRIKSPHNPSLHCKQFQPAEALQTLLHYATYFGIFGIEDKKRLLDNYIQIAGSVPVSQLTYTEGLDNLEGVLATVVDAVS